MKKILSFVSLCLVSLAVWGTEITQVTSKQVGDKVQIEYTIAQAPKGQLFDVTIFCSIDGETQANPLEEIKGDAGKDILGNGAKTVTWDVLSEYGALHGDVKFKVVAVPTKVLEPTTSKLAGTKVAVKSCTQKGDVIEVVVTLKNGSKTARFDLYTNYIKATSNKGEDMYAVDYVNGLDKVTTKRPIMIGANQTKELTIHFEAKGDVMYLNSLEIESKFPNDFAIIKNVIVD